MKEKISYEIRAGLNFASLSVDIPQSNITNIYAGQNPDFTGKGIQQGYHIGLLVNLPFLENIYLQTGLFLTTKGVFVYYAEKGVKPAYYLECPFLISYRQDINRKLKWDLNCGMYYESDIWVQDNGFAYGLILGAGLYHNRWYYGMRYDIGLTNKQIGMWYIDNNWNSKSLYDKNNVLSVSVGYKF